MIGPYLQLFRPSHWLKNLLLYFPPFLGGALSHSGMAERGIVPLAAFCAASSASYIFNDILDRENDAVHPRKRLRPIPAGTVPVMGAAILGVLLFAVGTLLAGQVSRNFLLILLAYLAVSLGYSLKLKELPVVDLFAISAGFMLRLQAGGEAFGVIISEWLFLCVLLLALFLSTGKRLCERNSLGEEAGAHRKSLHSYPEGYLDGTMYLTGGAVLVTYSMYVVPRPLLIYTVPLCCFGLLRYIFRVKTGQGGDPTEALLKDGTLFAVGLLWAVMFGWSVYR